MDTIKIINDTLVNNLIVKNDTLVHKVLLVKNESFDFFKMDNPFWYIMALMIGAFLSYGLTLLQKKKEAMTEAKKVLLNKRIELHEKIYIIFSKSLIVTNPTSSSSDVFYKIFESQTAMTDWFNELMNYSNENKFLISKNVNKNLSLLNNLRKNLHYLITNNPMSDQQLKAFAIKYHTDFNNIFKETEKSITDFFEDEITLDFKYDKLTDADYEKTQKRLYKYKLISDNFKSGDIV